MTLLFALPFLASAQGPSLANNYSQAMSKRLAFGLNRNATLYNGLVEQSKQLTAQGQDTKTIDANLAETKIIIDRGQANLAELPTGRRITTGSSTPASYSAIRQTVKEITTDIRLSYVKIKTIRLLIKNLPPSGIN